MSANHTTENDAERAIAFALGLKRCDEVTAFLSAFKSGDPAELSGWADWPLRSIEQRDGGGQ